jgi:ArsR family transcriptional regulator
MLKNEGELCACKILENFKITQPTLSYHMRMLNGCDIVKARRDGAWMRYTLNAGTIEKLEEYFKKLI